MRTLWTVAEYLELLGIDNIPVEPGDIQRNAAFMMGGTVPVDALFPLASTRAAAR